MSTTPGSSVSSSGVRDELMLAQRTGAEVTLTLIACLYGCCGRWVERRGYEQTYRGVIKDLLAFEGGPESLVLHAIAVSSLNYAVIAETADVLDVAFVD